MCVISVIIPAYNVEHYLSECLDSVLMQSITNFEILLVDDGSTDGTAKICDSYANRDSRIKVFHKINGGQSSARNLALSYVKGKYVFFLDADDKISPTAFAVLLENMEKYAVDILSYSFAFMDENSRPTKGFNFSYVHNRDLPSNIFFRDYVIL